MARRGLTPRRTGVVDKDYPAAGVRAISPTDIAQYIRMEQCARYLRLRLHERAHGPRFLADYGVAAQPIPPLLTRSGARFEDLVEGAIAARYPTVDLAASALSSKIQRPPDNARVTDAVRALAPGTTLVLFQARLQIAVAGWLMRGDIDVLRLARDTDGALHVLIADIKSSTAAKVEHRLQVAFYHEMLAALLDCEGIAYGAIELSVLYRGPAAIGALSDDAAGRRAEDIARYEAERALAENYFGTRQGLLEIVDDPESYRAAVRDLVTDPASTAARVAAAPFDDVPYHLTYKCDGCLYNEFCTKWSAERDDLSLLPHTTSRDKSVLRAAGVTTVRTLATLKGPLSLAPPAPSGGAWGDDSPQTPANHGAWRSTDSAIPQHVTSPGSNPAAVAGSAGVSPVPVAPESRSGTGETLALPGTGEQRSETPIPGAGSNAALRDLVAAPGREGLVARLAATPPVGQRLDELVQRARRYRRWKGDDLDALSYIPSKGYGSLPYCDAAHNPNLVRVYIDAQHDYLQDRVYMLGALVVACEDGAPMPARRRSVVHLTDAPPVSDEQERDLFLRWTTETIRAIVELAAPDRDGQPRAPIHLIFYDTFEQRVLLEGLGRHAESVLGATPLYDFVTALAAFDSPVVTFLEDEIRELKNYPMLCQSLQAVAAYLKFDWNSPAPYRELFRARLFDWWGKLEQDGDDATVDGTTRESPWYTARARFSSQIPLEYAYAAWGDLPAPTPDKRDDLAPYRAATPALLAGFHARRLEALERVAADFAGNKQTEKTPFELPSLQHFAGAAPTLAQALDEFVTIERHVELAEWKRARLAPPERRVLAGETLLARYVEKDQDAEVAARNRDNVRRAALKERYYAEYRAARPTAKQVRLPKEQQAEAKWSQDGLRVRLRLECAGLECELDEVLALSTLRVGEGVVLCPRVAVDSRLPADEQTSFTPTPKQMLYGVRGQIAAITVTRDAAGWAAGAQRRETNPHGRAVEGFVEVTLRESPGGAWSRGFVFASIAQPLSEREYTLDRDPNSWYGYWCAKVTEGLSAGQPNTLYKRLAAPASASVDWPIAAAEGQARFLAGLDALRAAGALHPFEESKRAYIGSHGDAPALLVQGPPGTGKSYATAFALFARLQGAMAADIDCRALLSCKTHAATDVLLDNVVRVQQLLRDLWERHLNIMAEYFDRRLLDTPLYRARPRGGVPDGVTALRRAEERGVDEPRNVDVVLSERWPVVASTPGAIYGMVKERWSDNLFGHDVCDLLVLDEASQMNLPEAAMAALPLKAGGALVVVGDHRQMPPIVKHDWAVEPRRTFKTFRSYESLFLTLLERRPPVPVIKFAESFRLHADMAAFLRQEVYRKDGIDYHSHRHEVLPPFDHADPFVAAVLAPAHPIVVVVHDEESSGQRNPFEQRLIAPIVEALTAPDTYNLDAEHGLGVVVPHRAQRAALQEAVPALVRRDAATGTVTLSAVDTVERFQGGERTAILVGATESERDYLLASSEFLLDPRRLTVALSRAKRKMILVASRSVFSLFSADDETFANAQLWKNLLRRACTVKLWEGERDGHEVTVWGNIPSEQIAPQPSDAAIVDHTEQITLPYKH